MSSANPILTIISQDHQTKLQLISPVGYRHSLFGAKIFVQETSMYLSIPEYLPLIQLLYSSVVIFCYLTIYFFNLSILLFQSYCLDGFNVVEGLWTISERKTQFYRHSNICLIPILIKSKSYTAWFHQAIYIFRKQGPIHRNIDDTIKSYQVCTYKCCIQRSFNISRKLTPRA